MTSKSKNTINKSYVEIRAEKRKETKRELRMQVIGGRGEGEFQAIADRAGVEINTVYKALNENQPLWSEKVIEAARAYIRERNKKERIKTPAAC